MVANSAWWRGGAHSLRRPFETTKKRWAAASGLVARRELTHKVYARTASIGDRQVGKSLGENKGASAKVNRHATNRSIGEGGVVSVFRRTGTITYQLGLQSQCKRRKTKVTPRRVLRVLPRDDGQRRGNLAFVPEPIDLEPLELARVRWKTVLQHFLESCGGKAASKPTGK